MVFQPGHVYVGFFSDVTLRFLVGHWPFTPSTFCPKADSIILSDLKHNSIKNSQHLYWSYSWSL